MPKTELFLKFTKSIKHDNNDIYSSFVYIHAEFHPPSKCQNPRYST